MLYAPVRHAPSAEWHAHEARPSIIVVNGIGASASRFAAGDLAIRPIDPYSFPCQSLSIGEYTKTLEKVLIQPEFSRRQTIVGLSMGGLVVARLLAKWGDAAKERIDHCYIVGASATSQDELSHRSENRQDAFWFDPVQTSHLAATSLSGVTTAQQFAVMKQAETLTQFQDDILRCHELFGSHLHLVAAENDTIVPPDTMQKLLPAGSVEVLAARDHYGVTAGCPELTQLLRTRPGA